MKRTTRLITILIFIFMYIPMAVLKDVVFDEGDYRKPIEDTYREYLKDLSMNQPSDQIRSDQSLSRV